MEITVEKLSPLTRKVTVVLPADTVSKELDTAYNKLKSEVQLKGFRKGKVPRNILEQTFRPRVQAEVGEKLVQATYFDAIEKEKLDVVAHPEIKSHNFENDGTFIYAAEVDTRPEFELRQYKGLEIEKEEILIEDDEIENELQRQRKEMAPLRSVDGRGIANNDIAVVDFQGYQDGEPVPQVKGIDASVDVGSGNNGKDFEEKLVGLKKGDETSFEIEFPPAYPSPILAGKRIEFKVTVKDVKERLLSELDDEFAKDVDAKFNTLDDLKTHIHDTLLANKEEAASGDVTDKIMKRLIEIHDFEVPGRLVQYEIDDYIKQTEERFKATGMTLESAGVNKEDMAAHYRGAAEKRVRGDFILKKIAEVEEIKLEEEDIAKGFGRIAAQYNMTVDEVKGYFKSREDMLPFLNELLNEKILKNLKDAAVFKVVNPEESTDDNTQEQESGDE